MVKITEREKEILKILQNDPMISQEDLAELVGITRSATAVHISNLIKKGFILGRGYVFNDKTGVLVLGPVYVEVRALTGDGDDGSAKIDIAPGGAAYLLARHLAGQGIPTSLMSVMGRDDWGEIIAAKLKKNNVDTKFLLVQKEYPTPRRVTLVDEGNNKITEISDRRALELLTGDNLQTMGVMVGNCRMLVMDTGIPVGVFRYVLGLAKEAEVPVCVRISDENTSQLRLDDLNGLFMVIMTGVVAGGLTNSQVRDLDDGIKTGKILNSLGAETVVTVLPDQGVVLTGARETVSVPILPVKGVKGVEGKIHELSVDVLTAGVVSGILHGYDYRQAIRLGLGMATHWVGKSRNLAELQEKQ